jgi:P27 family predicted phage terminase small subunit
MKKSGTNPPRGLSPEAEAWRRKIVEGFEIDDNAGALILTTAMEALDRLRQAQKLIDREGITTTDRFGQVKQHPATMVERDSRTALLRSLKALNLDIEAPGEIGRPPGR